MYTFVFLYELLVYMGFHFIVTHARHLSFQWRPIQAKYHYVKGLQIGSLLKNLLLQCGISMASNNNLPLTWTRPPCDGTITSEQGFSGYFFSLNPMRLWLFHNITKRSLFTSTFDPNTTSPNIVALQQSTNSQFRILPRSLEILYVNVSLQKFSMKFLQVMNIFLNSNE